MNSNTNETTKQTLITTLEPLVKWALLTLLAIVTYFLQKSTADYEMKIHQQNQRIEAMQTTINTLQLRDVSNSQTSAYIQERIRGLEVGREENRSRIEQLEKQMIKILR